jgi:hypothetical protein
MLRRLDLADMDAAARETDGSGNQENEPDALYLWTRQRKVLSPHANPIPAAFPPPEFP